MKQFKLASLVLAGAVGLSACSDEGGTTPLAPAGMPTSPTFSVSSAGQPTGQHLVAFGSHKLPSGFAERIQALGGTVDAAYAAVGVVVTSGLSDEAAAQLQASDDVQAVERDEMRQWLDPVTLSSVELIEASELPSSPSQPNTATFFPRQWHLRAIGADRAWANGRLGSSDVRVAILDTGIDVLHPDLAGRVDATRSRSFVPSDDALVRANFPGAPLWTDLHFHGTHVGATVSSNAVVAAGVTSKVTLMAVKVLGADGRSTVGSVFAGIMFAADNGADVINMSLGGTFRKSLNPGFVAVINRAINHANRQGVVVVVSAGNDNYDMDSDEDVYKTYCMSPHVICTSATGPSARASVNGPWTNIDGKASYSNYGSYISVAAPGGNGPSSVTAACSKTTLLAGFGVCRDPNRHFVLGANGTSMSSPHVSALAALLVEQIGKKQPSKVANRLMQMSDDLGVEGRDAIYGRGRINVAKALGLN